MAKTKAKLTKAKSTELCFVKTQWHCFESTYFTTKQKEPNLGHTFAVVVASVRIFFPFPFFCLWCKNPQTAPKHHLCTSPLTLRSCSAVFFALPSSTFQCPDLCTLHRELSRKTWLKHSSWEGHFQHREMKTDLKLKTRDSSGSFPILSCQKRLF